MELNTPKWILKIWLNSIKIRILNLLHWNPLEQHFFKIMLVCRIHSVSAIYFSLNGSLANKLITEIHENALSHPNDQNLNREMLSLIKIKLFLSVSVCLFDCVCRFIFPSQRYLMVLRKIRRSYGSRQDIVIFFKHYG